MIKLLLFLFLTPTENLPMIESLPLDYKGNEVTFVYDDRTLISKPVKLTRDEITKYYAFRREVPVMVRMKIRDDWYITHREGTRIFLLERLANGSKPDDLLYLLGRMQGRQYLFQPRPNDPDHVNYVWLDEWYTQRKMEEELNKEWEKLFPLRK